MPITEKRLFLVDVIRKGEGGAVLNKWGKPEEKVYGCMRLKSNFKREAMNYICVDKNSPFSIRIRTDDRDNKEKYGAVLFLDGQRIHGKKTFACSSNFLGYKRGGG